MPRDPTATEPLVVSIAGVTVAYVAATELLKAVFYR
jgi:hypothetical protein